MSNYNRVDRTLIGGGANSAATTIPGIQKGDLFLLDENNAIVATNAAAAALPKFSKVRIAMGTGDGTFVLSSPINGAYTSKYQGKSTVAPVEQITDLGYDGTNGVGIESSASTEYRLRVRILDDSRVHGQRPTLIDVNAETGTATTAAQLASKVACLWSQKEYNENFASSYVQLDRISDGVRSAFPASADATVVKNSKTVTFGAAHGLSAGDDVKFQGILYKVAGVTSTTAIVLDTPYYGASEVILVANADSGVYTAVTKVGFKLTALPINSRVSRAANEPLDKYEWVMFDAAFTDADDLASTQYSAEKFNTADANPGQGYWKQVADQEEFAKGYLGDTAKRNFYDIRIASNVDETVAYDSVIISHEALLNGDMQDTMTAPLKTQIYIPDGADQGLNSGDNFLHVLNGFFSGAVGFTAIAF